MDVLENLEENVTYEVLLLTGEGVNVNIKPFGLRYTGESFVFDLFPNRTLLNIKRVGTLTVYFLYDVLAFTKAFFDELTLDELGGICHCSIRCDVKSMESYMTDDSYGKNILTRIIAEPTEIITNNLTLPIINRATIHIIDVLVDFSRYEYMDVDARNNFKEKIRLIEKTVEKTGNTKHRKAMEIIKNRMKE